jgi:hypothetical protein
MQPPFISREPIRSVERSSIGSGPGPMERGEDTPKLATDEGLGSSANPNVLNRVAWAGGWQSKDRGSRAPQRTLSRLLPSQTSVYPQPSAFATYFIRFTGESPVQVQYTSVCFASFNMVTPNWVDGHPKIQETSHAHGYGLRSSTALPCCRSTGTEF